MSDAAIHPIRFILSDVDGTLLHPDHRLSQRTVDAVSALREAGVFFSLASGRPPKAMLHLIETFGIDVPVAGLERGQHGGGGLGRRRLVDTEADDGDLHAVVEGVARNGGRGHVYAPKGIRRDRRRR